MLKRTIFRLNDEAKDDEDEEDEEERRRKKEGTDCTMGLLKSNR